MLSIRFHLFAFLLLLSLSISGQELSGKIFHVQDGDSFLFESGDSTIRIRLFGIDCPEINQPYGKEAYTFLLRYEAREAVLFQRDVDKYGRIVADIFVNDTSLNYKLLESGFAWHYKKYSSDSLFSEAEKEAKEKSLGLWKDPYAIAPWDWRKGNYDRSKIQNDSLYKVFICVGKENMAFHHVHYCSELKSCESTTILVSPTEAIEVFNKSECQLCNKL